MGNATFAQTPEPRVRSQQDDRSTPGKPFAWRALLSALLGAPVRIHRYRDLHSRMVRDVLCRLDCGPEASDRCV